MKLIRDEQGLTLIEILAALTIFGFVSVLLSSVLFSITKTSTIQGQQVEYQAVANLMIAQIEKINRDSDIYKDANYFGKFNGDINWKETHIVKIVNGNTDTALENNWADEGLNPLYMTDINDSNNVKAEEYRLKDKNVKIKVLLQKNENDTRKSSYGTANYRDTFTIQTSGLILFYKEPINFASFYDSQTGIWNMEKLLTGSDTKEQILYSRKFVTNYRDDQKAKGDTPGNGRW